MQRIMFISTYNIEKTMMANQFCVSHSPAKHKVSPLQVRHYESIVTFLRPRPLDIKIADIVNNYPMKWR